MKEIKDTFKYRKRLNDKKDFPKIKTIPKKLEKSWGIGKFVMPTPLEVNDLMKKVPKGKLMTINQIRNCLLYTSPSPRDRTRSRMPSSA